MAAKGHVVIVSPDRALFDELAAPAEALGLELTPWPGPRQAGASPCAAVIVDFSRVPFSEREGFLAMRRPGSPPMIFLETRASLAPDGPSPLRRLPWPLPPGFADQVRAVERPVVVMADQTLFTTGAVQAALHKAGVQSAPLESSTGLVEFLHQQNEARIRASQKKSVWQRMVGDAEPEPPLLARVVVVQFSGLISQAEALDSRIRQAVPDAVCYHVSGVDPVREIGRAHV
jgi:hypothetical protein